MAGEHLEGAYWVRAIRPAFEDANRLFRRVKDKIELREHSLKLRFWPSSTLTNSGGVLIDMDWSWIRALPGLKVGELRIQDRIGGHDNLRVLFFVGNRIQEMKLPTIWVLRVLQKKRDDFSSHELSIIKGRRMLVLERFYRNPLS
jgi:hypothetical protein